MAKYDSGESVETITRQRIKVAPPSMYKVILLNDDVTTMDFVVAILKSIFQKSHDEATRIMLSIHHSGSGVCGIYPLEIAEAKQATVKKRANAEGFPLQCVLEKE